MTEGEKVVHVVYSAYLPVGRAVTTAAFDGRLSGARVGTTNGSQYVVCRREEVITRCDDRF